MRRPKKLPVTKAEEPVKFRPITDFFARRNFGPPDLDDTDDQQSTDHSESEPDSEHSEREPGSEHSGVDSEADDRILDRKWIHAWDMAFPWLKRDPVSHVVHCDICRDAKTANNWDIGIGNYSTNWKKDTFSKHATSKAHLNAAKTPALQTSFKRSIQKSYEIAKNITPSKLVIMRNILWTVQKELPITIAESAHNLIQHQLRGIKCLRKAPVVPCPFTMLINPKHTSNDSTYKFISAMNRHVVNQNNDDLKTAAAFSLHLDESTDISKTKIILLYTQHINAINHVQTVTFRAALKLKKADAESIVLAVTKFFTDNGIDMMKMVMLTSDGAAVMVGVHNGVAARLRRDIPHLISFHCAAHVQALAIKDVTKMEKHESFMHIERTLNELIVFLSTHNHTLGLETLADATDLSFTRLLRWIDIRWLSRSNSVTSIYKNLPVIQPYLEDASNKFAMAEGLYKFVTSIDFLVKLHALEPILAELNHLNLMFQDKLVHPLDVEELTETVCEFLQRKVIDRDIWKLKSMKTLKKRLNSNGSDKLVYKFKVPRGQDTTEREFIERKEKKAIEDIKSYTSDIIKSLKARLEKNIDEQNVLSASKIFDPERYKNLTDKQFEKCGKKNLRYLSSVYEGFGIDTKKIKREFDVLKSQVMNPKKGTDMVRTWRGAAGACLMPKNNSILPNLKILAEIILCFNASNAEVERGFSLMNRLKTPSRNRLKCETLDTLMRLRLSAESYKTFDYPAAYALWVEEPRYMEPGAPKRRKLAAIGNPNPESDQEDVELPSSTSAADNNSDAESHFSGYTDAPSPTPSAFQDVADAFDENASDDLDLNLTPVSQLR